MPTYTNRISFYFQVFVVFIVIFVLTVATIFFLSSTDILNKWFLVLLTGIPLIINFFFLYAIYDLFSFDPTGKIKLKYLGVITGFVLALFTSYITVLIFSMYTSNQIPINLAVIPLMLSIFYIWVATLLLKTRVAQKKKTTHNQEPKQENTSTEEKSDILIEDINELDKEKNKVDQEKRVYIDNIDKINQQRDRDRLEKEKRSEG